VAAGQNFANNVSVVIGTWSIPRKVDRKIDAFPHDEVHLSVLCQALGWLF
jgi:hypothetical protein